MPLNLVQKAAKSFALFVYYFLPIRKNLTRQQLRLSFSGRDETWISKTARESYINLVTTIFELMWTPNLTNENIPEIHNILNKNVLLNAYNRGKGLILMSGHFGNWEWLAIVVARALQLPFTVIVHPIHNRRIDELVEGFRTMFGNRVVSMGAALREVLTTLRGRGIVALLADQSGPSDSPYVNFVGRPAATYEGPALFALKTGAPIVIGYSLRKEDGTYDVLLEEIPTVDLTEPSHENILELTRRHVKSLEKMVETNPGFWLWQHKRWKHTPDQTSVIIPDIL